jgi:hypothetical protein
VTTDKKKTATNYEDNSNPALGPILFSLLKGDRLSN